MTKTYTIEGRELPLLESPYSEKQIADLINSDATFLEGVVEVDLGDIIDYDTEAFFDLISEKLVGTDLLMDISYQVVGFEDRNILHILVTGDASMVLEISDEGYDEEEGEDEVAEDFLISKEYGL